MVGERGEAHAAGRVEHGVHGEHQADDAGDGGGELGGAQAGILREGLEHIVQDVLLLADKRQAAGDIDVEGDPDAPKHGLPENLRAAYMRGHGIVDPVGRTLDEQETEEHHHRINHGEDEEHVDQPHRADQVLHQRAGDGLGQAEAGDGDAGGEALVVGEPKHQVLDRSQITDAQADAHDRAITDEHARQEVQGDAHARAGEADHEADHGDECGFLDVLLHHGAGECG